MKWNLHKQNDLMGSTEQDRAGWKGRSDADRQAALKEIYVDRPETGNPISRGHYNALAESMRNVLGGSTVVVQRGNSRADRKRQQQQQLDDLDRKYSAAGEDPRDLVQTFYDTYKTASDREYNRQAGLWFHPDKFAPGYKSAAQRCFQDVMNLRRR